jgi:hypothetical protein
MCWCVGLIARIENPLGRCDRLATTTSRERSSGAQAARIRRDRIDHGFEHITGLIFCKYHGCGLARLSKNCQGLICRPMLKRDRR